MREKLTKTFAACLVITALVSGCGSGGSSGHGASMASQEGRGPLLPHQTDALIYDGTAAATGGAAAIESIMEDRGWTYRTVGSGELDRMTVDELAEYGVIVWPGGYAGQMSNSLAAKTRGNIQAAVQERGVSFVGFCAGAFIAISPDARAGQDGPAWGFSLLDQETLDYYHLENEGIPDAMVQVNFPDGSSRELVWWGGPFLPEFPGGVIARYADNNQPAIGQAWAGRGLMVIAGPHPEAPENWRAKLGLNDSDGIDQDIAARMINAALTRAPMPAF